MRPSVRGVIRNDEPCAVDACRMPLGGPDPIVRLQNEEGKTVRASVFEVAQRLSDGPRATPPTDTGYASTDALTNPNPDRMACTSGGALRPATKRRRKPALAPRGGASVTREEP